MKKMKSLKFLALTAIFGALSMNAYADDEADRSVNGIKYKLVTKYKADGKTVDSRTATVQAINTEATADQKKTIVVPATVNGDNNVEYKVTGFADGWGANAADKCISLTINVDNMTDALAASAFSGFTKLENLVINDGGSLGKTKVFPTGVSKTIKTVDFSNSKIEEIAESAFEGCNALTSCPLDGIKKIGANAFNGTVITELTIPNTVESILENAFANMYYQDPKTKAESGLKKLTFNAGDKIGETIPSAFAGDVLLESVTITSAKAKSITAGAFTGDNDIHFIDLSGMTALETAPDDAFNATLRLQSLKLAGTKLKTVAPSLDYSNRSLQEITLPAEITTATLPSFKNFIALKAIDLSGTKVTEIPDGAFQMTDDEQVYYGGRQAYKANNKGEFEEWTVNPWTGEAVFIEPKLATVTLNPNTTKIGNQAFWGQSSLATVANLNQGKLESIGYGAFHQAAMTELDLSAATNKKFTAIFGGTFGEMKNLTTVTLPAQIENIDGQAFVHDKALTSINLQDTKIKVLNNIFTENWDDVENAPAGITAITLPDGLTTIMDYALQGLGIEEIVIPSTVTLFGGQWNYYIEDGDYHYYTSYSNNSRVLQGCVNLKKFTWKEAQQYRLPFYTFKGCTNLEEVTFFTLEPIYTTTGGSTEGDGLTDNHFFMNSKEKLMVYVSEESYWLLIGRGYDDVNSKYSTLVGDQVKEYAFSSKGKAADGLYYGTYHADYSSWFYADEVEVFTAVVERDKVELKPAEVMDGYYKIPQGSNVVLRSANEKTSYEIKGLDNNETKNNSLYGMVNHLWYCYYDGYVKGSKINYIYKLGVKDNIVAFYRITSGEFKEGQIFINAENWKTNKKDRLDIVIDGVALDPTAIQAITGAVEDANAPIYNLQGVRVQKAQKGSIYIQNGKKYIMK